MREKAGKMACSLVYAVRAEYVELYILQSTFKHLDLPKATARCCVDEPVFLAVTCALQFQEIMRQR